MKIEAGKYYRNRAGDVVGPVARSTECENYPFISCGSYLTEEGRFYARSPDHPYDLIEEVPAPHVEAAPEYGPEIQVDGKRPAWLADDDIILANEICEDAWLVDEQDKSDIWYWPVISKIRLPADHWAYQAIEQGFEPWAGGDTAPDDWDGEVLLRSGETFSGGGAADWKHHALQSTADIIGYRKKGEQVYTAKTISVGYTLTGDLATIARLQGENAALSAELAAARAKHPDLVPDPDRALKDEILAFGRAAGVGWSADEIDLSDTDTGVGLLYAWEKRNG